MQRTLALILAGGESPEMSVLTAERTESAMPFAGKFRVIDFTLSNCVNSGIYNVAVLTQHRPRSLQDHLGVGRPWDLDRAQGGLRMLHPSPTHASEGGGWHRGTADAVRYNLDFIEEQQVDLVLLLAGDHIYKMDYRPLLELHQEREADITLAVHSVSPHEVYRYGIVSVDANGYVGSFVEKPRRTSSYLASMGIYVFRKDFLIEILSKNNATSFGREILPDLVGKKKTSSYNFQGYWVDAGTVQAYYESNMALLAETPALDLYDPEWIIHTTSAQRPGVEIDSTARVENSFLSDGCRIKGSVIRSVLSPGVFVGPGATIRDSIILNDTWIGAGTTVDRCIVDEHVLIGSEVVLGDGEDNTPNHDNPSWLNTGITVVGMRTNIPNGSRIGRNVIVRPRVTESVMGADRVVTSGITIG